MSHLAWRAAYDARITPKLQQRSTTVDRHAAPATDPIMLQLSVDTHFVTQLCRLVARSCSDVLTFMRIQPIVHAMRMKAWLYLRQAAKAFFLQMALLALPGVSSHISSWLESFHSHDMRGKA